MSKGCYYKPDGSLFVLAGANKMEGGANNGTLRYFDKDDHLWEILGSL